MPEPPAALSGGGGGGEGGGGAEFFRRLMTKCFARKQSLRPNVNRLLISFCS